MRGLGEQARIGEAQASMKPIRIGEGGITNQLTHPRVIYVVNSGTVITMVTGKLSPPLEILKH
jgi:hypothetical protein